MNNRKKYFSILVFLFSAFTMKAQQGESYFNINYAAAFPTGSFKNIMSSNSYRGFHASLLYGISDKVSVGLGTGFQDYYEKFPRQLYKLADGSDLSAVLSYSIQTIPILASVKYSFTPEKKIQPYATLGVGANLVEYQQLLGIFGEKQLKFKFAARPEAGVQIPFRPGGAGFTIGASYNIMPFKQDDFKNLNSLAVHAGLRFPLRR